MKNHKHQEHQTDVNKKNTINNNGTNTSKEKSCEELKKTHGSSCMCNACTACKPNKPMR